MKYVKFKRPLILDGILARFDASLDKELYVNIRENVHKAREMNGGSDEPLDIVNVTLPYKEKYEGKGRFVGYLINYHGLDILIWDNDREKGEGEEGGIIPDELFEM